MVADHEPGAELLKGNVAMDGKSVGPTLDKPSVACLVLWVAFQRSKLA